MNKDFKMKVIAYNALNSVKSVDIAAQKDTRIDETTQQHMRHTQTV